MNEQWLPIADVPGYEVSDLGRVRSLGMTDRLGRLHPAKVLTNARMSGGYLRIRLGPRSAAVERSVHHLVLEMFVGPRPAGFQACHNDGDPRNNARTNLRWDTCAANQRDKIAHGTIARGERNAAHKLSEAEAAQVKALALAGVGAGVIGAHFGVSGTVVLGIRDGKAWAWLPPVVADLDAIKRCCVRCGKRFLPGRNHQRYCSIRCNVDQWRADKAAS